MSKIEDALPVPTHCDNCCSVNIELTTNDVIYGRIYGNWPKVYYCKDCTAAVGCHPGTEIPLGRMADRETRKLRTKAHNAFDPLWRNGYMTRSRAYTWLAATLGIDYSECHISWLSKEQLKQTAAICSEYLESNAKALERRKAKQNAKATERNKRTGREIQRGKTSR